MTKQDKIKKVMDEFKRGTLKTPDGKVVKNRKQALAIAMSESEDYAEKGDLINHLSVNSIDEALDILKAAGTEDLFEKAKHQDGDMHPNGKWVWVASANGGKGDWRTYGGRAHSKSQAGGSGSTASDSGKTTTTLGSSTTPKQSKTPKAKPTKFVDTSKIVSKIPNQEFKRITHILEKINPDSAHAENYLEDMTDKELNNFWACADHFKTDYQHINQSTRERCAKWKELANAEMSSRKKTKTSSSKTKTPTKEKKLRPVGTGTLGPTKREKDVSKKTSTSAVKETSTVDEMINQAIGSIEGTTGRKLSYKEKDNIRTKVASYNIKVKSDGDISKEATEGLHVMLGDWKENEFKHDIENNSIEELQSKIAKQNKNIKDAQDRYESIHSQMKKYYGTMPPHSLNQSYTAVREQLALERCKKLYIENEIEKRKKAAKILNDYVKGVK